MTEEELLKKIEQAKRENWKILDLSKQGIISLPKEIGNLSNLATLHPKNKHLLVDLPQEIVRQGTQAVLEYLCAKARGKEKQRTSKLVIVGQGGVGKTQMLRRLRREKIDNKIETTHGIEIHSLKLPHPKESNVDMELKACDFG